MRRLELFVLVVLMVSAAGAIAQPGEKEKVGKYRYVYQGDEVPEYLAFNFVARTLQYKQTQDSAAALKFSSEMFNTTADSNLEQLNSYVETYLSELEADNSRVARNGYCKSARSASRKTLYRALDSFEDGRHVRMKKHYDRFLAKLDGQQKISLRTFLNRHPISYYAIDHETEYEASPDDVRLVVTRYCEQVEDNSND